MTIYRFIVVFEDGRTDSGLVVESSYDGAADGVMSIYADIEDQIKEMSLTALVTDEYGVYLGYDIVDQM